MSRYLTISIPFVLIFLIVSSLKNLGPKETTTLFFCGKDTRTLKKGIKEKTCHNLCFSSSPLQSYGNLITKSIVISRSPFSINSNIGIKLGLLEKAKELRCTNQERGRVRKKLPLSHIGIFDSLSKSSAWFLFPGILCPHCPFCH